MEKKNRLDSKFLNGEFFAKLYCREIGVVPDKDSAHADYADLGSCHSYMKVQYEVRRKYFDDHLEMMDVFNLMSKHILKIPREWRPTAL